MVPFVVYIAFGYIARETHMVKEDLLTQMNAAVFKCFFPIMLFNNFMNIDTNAGFQPLFVLASIILTFLVTIISMLVLKKIPNDNSRKGVIVQAMFRGNSVLFAIPLMESVFGLAGAAAGAMLTAFIVPIYNVMAIVILEYYRGGRPTPMALVKKVVTNPLIIGAFAGILFLFSGLHMPNMLNKPITAMANMTTPISLFILGGKLHFGTVKKDAKALITTVALRLIIVPALVMLVTLPLPLSEVQRFAMFAVFITPVAVSSYSMAANMGGDADLAGELVTFTTVASLFTIFGWIMLLRTFGII